MTPPADHPILFFDGVCNLCNHSVDWIISRDKRRTFRFASLQGSTASEQVPEFAAEEGLSTVVLVIGGRKLIRSTAIGHVLKGLGGWWRFLGILFLLVPRPIRDWFYNQTASNRYRRWGMRETCRVPTQEESALFLP